MSNTPKTILWLIIIIVIVGGVWYSASRKATEETIKIGFMSALTGNYADIGNDVLRGVNQAIAEANQEGVFSRDIGILIEDNEADPTKAVSVYQLFKAKNAKIIFSSFSGVTGALSPLAKQDNIILMYNAVTPSFAEENDYAFKVYANVDQEAGILIDNIEMIDEKIGLAYVNNPSGNLLLEKLEPKIDIVSYSFDVKETDFKTIILKLKNEDIKQVIILGYPNQILDFIKQTVELEYSPQYIFANSDGSVSEVVDEVESYIAASTIKYITVGYGTKDQNYLFGHDLAKVLIEGMKKCQAQQEEPDNTECLKLELLQVEIQGKSGPIAINESGVAIVSPELYTIENKELVPYEYEEVDETPTAE